MTQRTVTDSSARTWVCDPVDVPGTDQSQPARAGVDVLLSCTTESVAEPVVITVGSGWEHMAPNGLARLVSQAAPAVVRRN